MKLPIKQHIFQVLLLIVIALPFAFSVRAYSVPKSIPPAGNTTGPFTEGFIPDIKKGGLSVEQFSVINGADFNQDASFRGIVTGIPSDVASGATPESTVFVQNSIMATGPITSSKIAVDNLATGGTTAYRKMCADKEGKFVVCGDSDVIVTDPTTPGTTDPGSARLISVTFDLNNWSRTLQDCSASFSVDQAFRTRVLKLPPETIVLKADIGANVTAKVDPQCLLTNEDNPDLCFNSGGIDSTGGTIDPSAYGTYARYCTPVVTVQTLMNQQRNPIVVNANSVSSIKTFIYKTTVGKEFINGFCVRNMKEVLAPTVPSEYQYSFGITITEKGGTGGRFCLDN